MHILNYKLNRIIDKTNRLLKSCLGQIRLTAHLKNPDIPVFQHLLMKNDTDFPFFQQIQRLKQPCGRMIETISQSLNFKIFIFLQIFINVVF